MKILITGANGMLAKAVKEELKENELVCTDVEELDITNLDAVRLYTKKVKPDYIINCAAYTAVDKAEEQEKLVYKINGQISIDYKNEEITFILKLKQYMEH